MLRVMSLHQLKYLLATHCYISYGIKTVTKITVVRGKWNSQCVCLTLTKEAILMDTDDILVNRLNALGNVKDNWKVKDIYPLLFRDAIWYQAYQNIYSNRGAFTKGINSDTLDGFDKNRISKIINSLKDKSYEPTPVRRVNIPKSNGKTRPLGIPTGTDKLVQEACRIILEAIYEPKFSNLSHGFRPKRSCHSALREIYNWSGTKWFIEFDIEGYFDNINHDILLDILKEKIVDGRFIALIYKFLTAGYLENWKYSPSFSGTPQGGIISPILANIYLDKLDKFLESKCNKINSTSNERKLSKEYHRLRNELSNSKVGMSKIKLKCDRIQEYIKINIEPLATKDPSIWNYFNEAFDHRVEWKGDNDLARRIKTIFRPLTKKYKLDENELLFASNYKDLKLAYGRHTDILKNNPDRLRKTKAFDTSDGLCRLRYVRYADDFLLGFIGTKDQATVIFNEIEEFLDQTLKLKISINKSGIKNKKGVRFLGYDISMPHFTDSRITDSIGRTLRRNICKPVLKVPVEKAVEFVKNKKYGSYVEHRSVHKGFLANFDELEIIKQYNAELRGLINYYQFAVNCKNIIGRVQWIAHYSLLKTIAKKRKCSVAQLFKKKIILVKKHYRIGKTWYITVGNKDVEVFNIKDVETKSIYTYYGQFISDNSAPKVIRFRNSAVKSLINDTCEICGKTGVGVTIHQHHVNPVRNIPNTDTIWDKVNKMRLRKTIAVCRDCHTRIHHG